MEQNDKQRFAFNDDKMSIGASQGHWILIDRGLEPAEPLGSLHHGTAERFVASIKACDLLPDRRNHVHLSVDEATGARRGTDRRHGNPIVLRVQAGQMYAADYRFYLSANGVWLTEHVPVEHLGLSSDQHSSEHMMTDSTANPA